MPWFAQFWPNWVTVLFVWSQFIAFKWSKFHSSRPSFGRDIDDFVFDDVIYWKVRFLLLKYLLTKMNQIAFSFSRKYTSKANKTNRIKIYPQIRKLWHFLFLRRGQGHILIGQYLKMWFSIIQNLITSLFLNRFS